MSLRSASLGQALSPELASSSSVRLFLATKAECPFTSCCSAVEISPRCRRREVSSPHLFVRRLLQHSAITWPLVPHLKQVTSGHRHRKWRLEPHSQHLPECLSSGGSRFRCWLLSWCLLDSVSFLGYLKPPLGPGSGLLVGSGPLLRALRLSHPWDHVAQPRIQFLRLHSSHLFLSGPYQVLYHTRI